VNVGVQSANARHATETATTKASLSMISIEVESKKNEGMKRSEEERHKGHSKSHAYIVPPWHEVNGATLRSDNMSPHKARIAGSPFRECGNETDSGPHLPRRRAKLS
jgi:hypothetical protein